MNTKQLYYVLTLAHEGSFSRAAEALNITQPFIPSLPKREVVVMWRKDRKLSKIAEELVSIIHSIEW